MRADGAKTKRTGRADRVRAANTPGWIRASNGCLISNRMPCTSEEWYLARARLKDSAEPDRAVLLAVFSKGSVKVARRCVRLSAVNGEPTRREMLGWFQAPAATHWQLCLPRPAVAEQVAELAVHHVSERDPKCHPLANVPRWSVYRPPWDITRLVLPKRLAGLAEVAGLPDVRILDTPSSLATLRSAIRRAACVLDGPWVTKLGLSLADLEHLAADSWLLVDLETLARRVTAAGAADAQLVRHAAQHGLMSARVEYADVPTRGMALQDVVPYTAVDDRGRFCVRGIKAGRSWKSYADTEGFATLLSVETPWVTRHGDVLSAMRAVGRGELIATDLPWLVAGLHGPLLAPRLAAHLLRMHLAGPVQDHLQYWTRWEDANTIVRDIADLERRYAPLRAVRWAAPEESLAHLGVVLAQPDARPTCSIVLSTGRIDNLDAHDGLPPEPMMIFMKWLAREVRDGTPWARRHLAGKVVTWRFETADGLKYAANYDATGSPAGAPRPAARLVRLRLASPAAAEPAAGSPPPITLADDEGLHGDGSLRFQDTLTGLLRREIEAASSADA